MGRTTSHAQSRTEQSRSWVARETSGRWLGYTVLKSHHPPPYLTRAEKTHTDKMNSSLTVGTPFRRPWGLSGPSWASPKVTGGLVRFNYLYFTSMQTSIF